MLNNHASRFGKGFYALKGSVGIGHVVIRERFALKHVSGSNARLGCPWVNVKGCLLMGVFAIAHVLLFIELQVKGAREGRIGGIDLTPKVVSNCAIVPGGVFECFNR